MPSDDADLAQTFARRLIEGLERVRQPTGRTGFAPVDLCNYGTTVRAVGQLFVHIPAFRGITYIPKGGVSR